MNRYDPYADPDPQDEIEIPIMTDYHDIIAAVMEGKHERIYALGNEHGSNGGGTGGVTAENPADGAAETAVSTAVSGAECELDTGGRN
jgi:hypothetical protein